MGDRIPQEMIDKIDGIVATGLYRSRGDFVMTAVRLLLEKEAERGISVTEEQTTSGRT